MPYYNKTLADLLDDPTFVPECQSGIFENVARLLIRQMCAAVAYLDDQCVAHRDISPTNWLINERGSVVLIDFGVAWSEDNSGSEGTTGLQFELGTG